MRRTSLLAPALALALAAVLCFDGAAAAADTVADSCDAIRDYVDFNFCASRLRAVPWAASADRQGHIVMAADLAVASGAAAGDAAAGAARAETDPARRDTLRACEFLYGAGSVPALRIMRGYAAARSWDAARALFMITQKAGIGCAAALGCDAGRMAGANGEFSLLSTMAATLLNTVSS